MLRQAQLYLRTIRYLKPIQIFGRIGPEARKRLLRAGLMSVSLPDVPIQVNGRLRPRTPFFFHEPWNTSDELRKGVFKFLNEASKLGWPPEWQDESRPILWNYNLHYFNYLHLLDPDSRLELCRAWIRDNPVGRTVGWYPYPLSLRIVNWCKARLDDETVNESLFHQTYFLSRNMEVYHPGNHLLENAKSLIIAGLYFQGTGAAEEWVDRGLGILREELPQQVLDDGGYFERSPMYHAIMLEGLLDICNLLPAGHTDQALIADYVRKMCDFLYSTTHPDGEIALFNDSAQEIGKSTACLLDYARSVLAYSPTRRNVFDESGYYVMHGARSFLVVDGGPIGPDFIPAHAHADLFSFEMSVDDNQFIVDSGTFDYVPGPLRSHLRSTRAHNTVCIDDVDQAECWKSHRVGRRFSPKDVSVEDDSGGWRFGGSFDGYATLIGDGIVHRREFVVDKKNNAIECTDLIDGAGRHLVESRLHFHPDVRLRWQAGALMAERNGTQIEVSGNLDDARLEESVYCPRFGVKIANKVLVMGGARDLPAQLRFRIRL